MRLPTRERFRSAERECSSPWFCHDSRFHEAAPDAQRFHGDGFDFGQFFRENTADTCVVDFGSSRDPRFDGGVFNAPCPPRSTASLFVMPQPAVILRFGHGQCLSDKWVDMRLILAKFVRFVCAVSYRFHIFCVREIAFEQALPFSLSLSAENMRSSSIKTGRRV